MAKVKVDLHLEEEDYAELIEQAKREGITCSELVERFFKEGAAHLKK